jgi:hypothetical protein
MKKLHGKPAHAKKKTPHFPLSPDNIANQAMNHYSNISFHPFRKTSLQTQH